MNKLSIYVAGPLTHLKDPAIKDLYVAIGKLAEELDIDAIVPHVNVEQHSNLFTPQFIYHADRKAVREADVMIAYIGEVSLGVGVEIEIANQNNTILVTYSEEGTKISRMVLGSPSLIMHIEFKETDEVLAKLRPVLEKLKASLIR